MVVIILVLIISGFISDKALSITEREFDSGNQKPQIDENASTVPTISDMMICYAAANGK